MTGKRESFTMAYVHVGDDYEIRKLELDNGEKNYAMRAGNTTIFFRNKSRLKKVRDDITLFLEGLS